MIRKLGAEHFSSQVKRARHSNYTLESCLNECVDNVIKKAKKIDIDITLDNQGKLTKISISDNYEKGFEHIECEGRKNPFYMGCLNSSAHDDDNETSEFGLGLKTASIYLGNNLEVFTSIGDKTFNVRFDYNEMKNTEDVLYSYEPEFLDKCTREQYLKFHKWEKGSTIIIKNILDTICSKTTEDLLVKRIITSLGDTYGRFLYSITNTNGCELRVNGELVEPSYDFFKDIKCQPFIKSHNLSIIENTIETEDGVRTKVDDFYKCSKNVNKTDYHKYNRESGKWDQLKKTDYEKETCNKILKYVKEWPIEITSIFVFYSDKFKQKDENSDLLPGGRVSIYKDNRLYGKKPLKKTNNGSDNYTLHTINFYSKKIGKLLGITYNKTISLSQENDLTSVVKSILNLNRNEFNADTSNSKNKKLYEKALKHKLIEPGDRRTYKNKKDKIKNNKAIGIQSIIRGWLIRKQKINSLQTPPHSPKDIKKEANKKTKGEDNWYNLDNNIIDYKEITTNTQEITTKTEEEETKSEESEEVSTKTEEEETKSEESEEVSTKTEESEEVSTKTEEEETKSEESEEVSTKTEESEEVSTKTEEEETKSEESEEVSTKSEESEEVSTKTEEETKSEEVSTKSEESVEIATKTDEIETKTDEEERESDEEENESDEERLLEIKDNNQKALLNDLQNVDFYKLSIDKLNYYYYKVVQEKGDNPQLENLLKIISEQRSKMKEPIKREDIIESKEEELLKTIYLYQEDDIYKVGQRLIEGYESILKLPVSKDVIDRLESSINSELERGEGESIKTNKKNMVKLIINEYSKYL